MCMHNALCMHMHISHYQPLTKISHDMHISVTSMNIFLTCTVHCARLGFQWVLLLQETKL
jgi:hypothetical protein